MSLLVYGATGWTGQLIVQAAQKRGLTPMLIGRDAQKLAALAVERDLPWRAVRLDDRAGLKAAFAGATVIINAAGPFWHTTDCVLQACLDARVHYLDVSGEIDAITLAAGRDQAARARGLTVMPAVGFDVIASDCLGLHLLARAARPRRLRLALARLGAPSAGSRATMMEEGRRPLRVRRDGVLRELLPGSTFHRFPFASGTRMAAGISWGDLATAHYTLGVRDVETYAELTHDVKAVLTFQRAFQRSLQPRAWLREPSNILPAAEPSSEGNPEIVAELDDDRGNTHVARLHTGDVYRLSADLSVEIATRVLAHDLQPGFQTAARIYGADFILGFEGVSRVDVS